MKSISEIYEQKKSDTAVFLGSGSSINNISDDQWEAISKTDTWTVNNWVYHPFIPRFYHVEVKSYNKDIVKRRIAERGDDYNNTNFIVNKNRKYILDVIGPKENIYSYKMNKINVVKENIIPKYKPDINTNILTCNLNSSLTMLLELMCRLKYKRVVFFGVDLFNSLYFWTDKLEYGETHCQWNKDHEGRKPDQPHNTSHVKNFIVWFSEKRMSEIGGKFFVGHKDTMLYPDLDLYDITRNKH
jgi:hypothetical protein